MPTNIFKHKITFKCSCGEVIALNDCIPINGINQPHESTRENDRDFAWALYVHVSNDPKHANDFSETCVESNKISFSSDKEVTE